MFINRGKFARRQANETANLAQAVTSEASFRFCSNIPTCIESIIIKERVNYTHLP